MTKYRVTFLVQGCILWFMETGGEPLVTGMPAWQWEMMQMDLFYLQVLYIVLLSVSCALLLLCVCSSVYAYRMLPRGGLPFARLLPFVLNLAFTAVLALGYFGFPTNGVLLMAIVVSDAWIIAWSRMCGSFVAIFYIPSLVWMIVLFTLRAALS